MVAGTDFPAFSPFGLPRVISAFNGRLGTPQRARISLRIHRLNNNSHHRFQAIKSGFQKCKNMHNFAQFLKRRFCCAAPALTGPGRSAQSAQKEVGLARRRGGGASARFGGREGVGIPRQKPPAGRALSRCIRRAGRQNPARVALAASGW